MPIKRLEAGKHNCVGSVIHMSLPEEASEERVEREVLMVYAGEFDSMDGPVRISEEHIDRLVANHNSRVEKLKRLAQGNVSVKGYPPLQVDHSSSALMTIGRVTGELEKKLHVLDDGSTVPAMFGKVTILGRENVEKVKDGRWQDVSIGADLDTGKLNELSITPFPAAEFAAMLSKGRQMKTFAQFKASLKGLFNLAADKDCDEKAEKMKKYLMEKDKLSAEDAEKKMSEMDDEAKKKLAADVDEDEKKMAAQDPAKEEKEGKAMDEAKKAIEDAKKVHESEMSAIRAELTAAKAGSSKLTAESKDNFVKLAKGFKDSAAKIQLQARKANLSARLSGLKASAKITPAEIKKIDLDKLAGENDATVEAVLKTYEGREPVILAGIMGSAKAENLAALASNLKKDQLEQESRRNMSLKSKEVKADEAAPKRLSSEPFMNPVAKAEPITKAQYETAYNEVVKLMASGKGAEAETALKALFERILKDKSVADGGVEMSTHVQTEMSALAESVKTLHTQFEELVKLVGPNLGVETSEI